MSNEGSEQNEIQKATTAFQFFQKLQMTKIKEELISNAQDANFGALIQASSQRWKQLSDSERFKYEELARQDKERFERESEIRNAEVLKLQEERRRQNALTETESRMRNSTMLKTESSHIKADTPKRKRELSEREKEASELRKQAKQDEENAIQEQHQAVTQSKAAQAEARLKYLLNQSDIFAHFGVKSKGKGGNSSSSSIGVDSSTITTTTTTTNITSGTGRSKKGKENLDEDLDEDELAMREEEEDDDSENNEHHQSHSMTHVTTLTRQPSCITGDMRPYQLEGLNWMIRLTENGINGILADEMGLGKTLQSISMLGYLHEYKNITGPHLIVVPKTTLSNWMNEFQRWCPLVRPLRFHGGKEERSEFIETYIRPAAKSDDREWDALVTTYEIFNLEKTALSKIAWRFTIIDEAHRLKNEASMFSQNIRNLNTEHRLLLTGTPLQNNLHELWALLNFLLPEVFASSEQFDEWFNLDVDDTEAKQRMISQLHKILRPFMLRRLKVDVEKSLPPKTETILFTGLSVTQKNVYRQVLLRDIDQINTNFGNSNSNNSRTAILNIVMQLRKCCNHPYLFPGVEDRNENPFGEHIITNCGKMVLLDKLLRKLFERKNRVLVFSQMTRMLDILEDYCTMRGFEYCRIDGNTSYEDREDRIASYNAPGSSKFIFLLSTRAGGLGINLQTADTVIIYDSDWNPQADLQAQDRCHRIGQTKQVHVYRLVTDDTVEVKVVERAQQKLKLDAMVVQQGRLADKDRKMSKTELLDTLKFGADKIFRTKDSSSITDEDIDIILEMGRKRTEELNEKLQTADKGDLYDFRLDGNTGTQVFEGKDYSDRSMRENMSNAYSFIDTGPRERKTIGSYNESSSKNSKPSDPNEKKQAKLPRHLRLPKMEDWQFFNRERLNELQEEENKLFEQLIEKGETPQAGSMTKLILLSPEQHEEKLRLLSEAFGDWNRNHYSNFLKASAKYGRKQYQKISEDVSRPIEDIQRYATVFWERGPTAFPPTEWEKVVKAVEKGEKRLEEIDRLTIATSRLVNLFNDPWEELVFRNIGGQGRLFNAIEDRYLLCLTHLHGYGNWDRVRSSIRRCERFRFDYYLLSCTSEALGKRCESLMRLAEREMIEIDRKQQAIDSTGVGSGLGSNNSVGGGVISTSSSSSTTTTTTGTITMNANNKSEGNSAMIISTEDNATSNERMSELVKQIAEEARKLAATRAELQKAKKQQTELGINPEKSGKSTNTNNTSSGTTTNTNVVGKKSKTQTTITTSTANDTTNTTANDAITTTTTVTSTVTTTNSTEGSTHKGMQKMTVPDSLIPELCRRLVAAGADGMNKIVIKFVESYPTVSKRQVEMKINELAIKEKRATDSQKVWHIKREFEHFLEEGGSGGSSSATTTATTATTAVSVTETKSETKKKSDSVSATTSTKKRKTTETSTNNDNTKKSRAEKESASTTPAPTPTSTPVVEEPTPSASTIATPKKQKTAFELFVKEKRAEVEETLGPGIDKDQLKRELKSRWLALTVTEQDVYEKKLEKLDPSKISSKRSNSLGPTDSSPSKGTPTNSTTIISTTNDETMKKKLKTETI